MYLGDRTKAAKTDTAIKAMTYHTWDSRLKNKMMRLQSLGISVIFQLMRPLVPKKATSSRHACIV